MLQAGVEAEEGTNRHLFKKHPRVRLFQAQHRLFEIIIRRLFSKPDR